MTSATSVVVTMMYDLDVVLVCSTDPNIEYSVNGVLTQDETVTVGRRDGDERTSKELPEVLVSCNTLYERGEEKCDVSVLLLKTKREAS